MPKKSKARNGRINSINYTIGKHTGKTCKINYILCKSNEKTILKKTLQNGIKKDTLRKLQTYVVMKLVVKPVIVFQDRNCYLPRLSSITRHYHYLLAMSTKDDGPERMPFGEIAAPERGPAILRSISPGA